MFVGDGLARPVTINKSRIVWRCTFIFGLSRAPTPTEFVRLPFVRRGAFFREEQFSLRLGHTRVLTSHCDVIHCARVASLRRSLRVCASFFHKSNIGEQAGSRWSLTAIGRFYCQRTNYANYCPKLWNGAETLHSRQTNP